MCDKIVPARKYKLAKAILATATIYTAVMWSEYTTIIKSTAHLSVYIAWCSELIMTSKYLDASCDHLQSLQQKLCSYLPFLLCCPFVVAALLGGPMNYRLVKAFSSKP